ncbi:hypothetical protein [Shinella pollutisoli]|uniref:Uncharacterized protein n=1 Tax=Shinella pollutisoli TaxID=2250594 RepID=A0ABV7DLB4_9HYPH|nr:hypothetical protein [Shinella pollutisoli]
MPSNIQSLVGKFFGNVELETCRDANVSRPRVRPISQFSRETKVEFPRQLREIFPIGTKYIATVKVCQKHENGETKGQPYLKAYDIAVVASSVKDEGLMARVKKGSISGLSYEYVWKTRQ